MSPSAKDTIIVQDFNSKFENLNIKNTTTTERSSASGGTPPKQVEKDKPKKSHRDKIIVAVAGFSIISAAVGGGLYAANSGAKAPEGTSSSAPAVPITEPTTLESAGPIENSGEYSVSDLEIPTGLSSEELGKLIVEDRFSQWFNAGFEAETVETLFEKKIEIGQFATTESEKQAKVFADALFVPGWETTVMNNFYTGAMTANGETLELALKTSLPRTDDEHFRRFITTDNITEISADENGRTISVDYTENTNSSKNRVGTGFFGDKSYIDGATGTFVLNLVPSADGKTEKIESYTVANIN